MCLGARTIPSARGCGRRRVRRHGGRVDTTEIAPGLVRWTAPHPEWRAGAAPGSPADWEQMRGSVLYELPDAVALIDPLLPAYGRDHVLRCLEQRMDVTPVSI